MNRFGLSGQKLRIALFVIASTGLLASTAGADDATGKNSVTNAPAAAVSPPAKPVLKKLTGTELYAINCNRCHPERYANERTPAQWETIMLHMRVRANIPAEQAREIVKFLQEDSGD